MSIVSITATHTAILGLLGAAGIDAALGPRTDAPGQYVTVWPSVGVETYTRTCGGISGRTDRVDLTCTGPTVLDALAVVSQVRQALGGVRLAIRGGILREDALTGVTAMTEPGANPVRASFPISFTVVTKGTR